MCVSDIYQVGVVSRYAGRAVEFAFPASRIAPAGDEVAIQVENGDTAGVFVGDEEATLGVLGYAGYPDELPFAVAGRPECSIILAFDVAHGHADAPVNTVH